MFEVYALQEFSGLGFGVDLTCRLIPYPFFGYLILGLGSQNHKIGYPKRGMV